MRKALGRGIEALFPASSEAVGASVTPGATRVSPATSTPAGTMMLAPAEIAPNPEQPRRHFDPDALAALGESLRRHGLLQPLVVRRVAGRWELIAGERRLRAAVLAGLTSVPVVVRETPDEDRLELALIENLQRENLTPLEEAEAYRHLIDTYGFSQEEVAQRVGKSRPAITNALRLLGLPDAVKARLESGEISAAHGRAILTVEGADARIEFSREIVTRKLSKAESERQAAARRRRPAAAGGRATAPAADVHLKGLAEELTRGLGTKVRIVPRGSGGAIEIEFYSNAELDRLVDQLRTVSAGRAQTL